MERHTTAHLWAIGYDSVDRAGQMRDLIASVAGPQQCLQLLDTGVLVRWENRTFTLNGGRFTAASSVTRHGILGLLAGFALAVPLLSSDAVARAFDSPGPEKSEALGIDEIFKHEIASMMQPATSALLVLDVAQNMNAILPRLEGMGGRILKTNVDIKYANLIQRTLARKTTL